VSEDFARHTFGTKMWKRENNVKMSRWERPAYGEVD
jgi:hypothetical protein